MPSKIKTIEDEFESYMDLQNSSKIKLLLKVS
jgi:hypothetical protein